MAQTSNDLLGAILVTLKSIDNTTQKTSQEPGGGGAKTTISSVLAGLGKIKPTDREGYTTFVRDIAKIANDSDPKKLAGLTEGIISMSNAMPSIAEGLNSLGKIKSKKVERAKNILTGLFNFFLDMGEPKNTKKVNRAINTFDSMGLALNRIAKPLNSMAFLLLKFGLSIVGFAGSLILASMMMGAGMDPMAGLGIIVAIIVGFVGLMALLGAMGGVIRKGSKVLKRIGIGLMAIPIGLVIAVGALILIPKMLGENPDYDGMMTSMKLVGLVLGGAILLMAGIGFFKSAILKGVAVSGAVALGLVFLAGGALMVAMAAQAISGIAGMGGGMDEDKKQTLFGMEVPPFVYGLGVMGAVILGGIALFAILGIPVVAAIVALGAAVGIGVAVAMVALAYSVKELVSISKELDGTDVAKNVSTMIGGVLRGFADGMWMGLAGGKAPDNWVDALKTGAKMAARVALIMGGIALVSGVAVALSLFALSLRAFSKVGQIAPITGHDTDGKPIYGKAVTVAQVAANIAGAIGIFFNTLGDLFDTDSGKSPLPSKEQMDKIVYALMGSGGFRVFGVEVARSGPNLMDALYQFGDVLTYWGKFGAKGEIPGGTDKDGKPKDPVKITKVATNITDALKSFMTGLSGGIMGLDEDLAKQSMEVAYILLGKKNTGALGWYTNLLGITRDRPGILEPVAKFGEIITQFSKNQYISGYDNDGNPEYKTINYKVTADKIVKGIQDFTTALATGLTKADSSGVDYGKQASKAGAFLEDFEDLFDGLEKLSAAQTGMDRLAASLNSVGEGIGLIAKNVGILDVDKFDSIANTTANYQRKTADLPPVQDSGASTSGGRAGSSLQDTTDWDNISSMIGQKVGQQVSAAFSSGQFKFEFQSPTGGIMTLEQD